MTSGRSTAIPSVSHLGSGAADTAIPVRAEYSPQAPAPGAPREHLTWPRRRPAPAEAGPRHLAPALQAAAAARARTERIRAESAAAVRSGEAPTAAQSKPGLHADPAAAAPPAAVPATAELARRAALDGWAVSAKPASALGSQARRAAETPPDERRFRGLSVAAAARAATIAFRPARRLAAAAVTGGATAPGAAAVASGATAPAAAPALTRPPAATMARRAHPVLQQAPAPATMEARRPGPDEQAERQRFARTIAELERYLAASRKRELGSNIVPRPTLPLVDQETSGPAWLRLWSRRKAGS